MTNIPWDELKGNTPLNGIYKVTFLLDISKDDYMTIDDLRQCLAASFTSDPVLEKTAKLEFEKTDKDGNPLKLSPDFKVGDTVIVKEDVTLIAQVSDFNGHYVVGAKEENLETIGEATIIVPEGAMASINKIDGNNVELVDFEEPFAAGIKNEITGETKEIVVNIDSVMFSNNSVGLFEKGEN